MRTEEIQKLVQTLGRQCLNKKIILVTAESCTGGLLAESITSVTGSSQWFDRGYITYSNQSKIDCLDVLSDTISQAGAVSQETANQMALGAIHNSKGNMSISITGLAGPTGGTKIKPIGTIFFSIAQNKNIILEHQAEFKGNRLTIRKKALLFALNQLLMLTL